MVLRPALWLPCWASARHAGEPDPRSIAQRRAEELRSAHARPVPPDALVVRDHAAPVTGGHITVRSYRPATGLPLPAYLFLHSGAFWAGSIDQLDPLARRYAARAGSAVFSVGYRLAPEHRWPTAAEDGYAALRWLAGNAAALGVDGSRIAVGGVSAGGGLAAVVALMARDRHGPPVVFQLLEIPAVDLTASQPSMTRFATGKVVTRASLVEGYDLYLPDAGRRRHPYASPLLADDLRGLPPAFVLTCEYDPLRDEGEAYAARLRAAGVPARTLRARGHVHGSTYVDRMRSARRYQRMTADVLAAALR